MKGMEEDQDVGGSVFEDRIRNLFQSGVSRGVSASSVMHGARRRRVRRRATAAGASFAVLGVAAGAVAFGGHAVGPSRMIGIDGAVTRPAATSPATGTPAAPTSTAPTSTAPTSPTSAAETCSASVGGTTPPPTPMVADGLGFEKVSGSSAGATWSAQIHVFPGWQNWLDWRTKQPVPPGPETETNLQRPPALLRTSGNVQVVLQQADHHFFGFSANSVGGPIVDGVPKAFLLSSWIEPGVDHLCLQFAHHAEFEPVYRIQGGSFAVFSYTTADEPLDAIAYDAAGHELGRSNGKDGLRPPPGK